MRSLINPTQALILGALHSTNMSGSQIIDIAKKISGFWNNTKSQVYREIPGLRNKGYIDVITDEKKVPPMYKELYEITQEGREAYRKWQNADIPLEVLRNPWMLRYILCDHDGSNRKQLCINAALYYHNAHNDVEDDDDQVGVDALRGYYSLMESWFIDQAR